MNENNSRHEDPPPLHSSTLRIELFGALRVVQGSHITARFYTYKTGALLGYLAFHRRQIATREMLIDLLWQEGTPERGRNNLSFALSSLRNQLEPPGAASGAIILADRHTVRLNTEAVQTDVNAFEQALNHAEHAEEEASIPWLKEAVALYSGELLPGYYEAWIVPERDRLAERYVQALRRLVRHCVKQKESSQAQDYARRAVAASPLREELYRDLIRLLLATGQPSAALEQYHALEKSLREALDDAPSAATQQLLRDIEAARSTPISPAPARPVSVPAAAAPATLALVPSAHVPPVGSVTLLLTSLVGETALWEHQEAAIRQALTHYHTLLRSLFAQHSGYAFKGIGEGFLAAFQEAHAAARCAMAIQRGLADHLWPAPLGTLRTRMALVTGEAELEEGTYVGLTPHRASRLLAAAHGGQIVCGEILGP